MVRQSLTFGGPVTHPTRAVVLCISTILGACGSGGGTADAPSVDHFAATPASVCAGGQTTLAWGFSGGTGVITPGDFTAPSDTGENSVTVAATTTFVLTVTSSSGLTTAQATVTALPLPAVAITAPTSIAAGASTFTASVPARTSASYGWRVTSGNGTVSQGASTREATVSVTGTGDLVLEATITDSATGCAGVATASVALPGAPAVTSFAASSTPVCQGDAVDLSYVFANGAGTIMPGPVVLSDNAGRVTVTPDTSTTYVLTVSGTGTPATAEAAVTVLPNPDATITAPSSAVASATGLVASVPALAGATYAWTVTGGSVTAGAGTREITFDAGASGSMVLSVTVTDAASSCAATREVTIPIVAPPPAITTFTATPTTLCPGESTRLDYAFTNGAGTITPGSIALPDLSGFVTTPVAATTTYTLTVHGTAPDATAQVTVTALAAPDATITAPAQALVGATGLTASVPAGSYGFAWSVLGGNAIITSAANSPAITFDVTGTSGSVTLQVVVTDDASGCQSTRTASIPIVVPSPVINTFTATKSSVCAGSTVRLDYDFAHGAGVITPGPITLADTSGTVSPPVDSQTTFTLTVTGTGTPATAQVTVGADPLPASSITVATSAPAGTATPATGPSGAGLQYYWSVTSGNGDITAGQGTAAATFVATAPGTLTLALTVTDGTTGCHATVTKDVSVTHGCATPVLMSTDWTQNPVTPAETPSAGNMVIPGFAVSSSGEVWMPFLAWSAQGQANNTMLFDLAFNRASVPDMAVLGGPTTARFVSVQGTGHWVSDARVAVDDAGNAVFAWLETDVGGSWFNWVPYVRGYRAADNTLGPALPIPSGRIYDWNQTISVALHHSSGKALVSWIQTTGTATHIPHVIDYDVTNLALGTDVAFRTATANSLSSAYMSLDLQVNANLDGFAMWYEEDASYVPTLYSLHFTGGVPDKAAGVPDVQALVVGGSTNTSDLLNQNSKWFSSWGHPNRLVSVSSNGNAGVVWGVYNWNAPTGTPKTSVYAMRYLGGSWQARETVSTAMPSDARPPFADWAIDDQGDMLVVFTTSSNRMSSVGLAGAAWTAPAAIPGTVGNGAPMVFLDLDHTTGNGFVTTTDASAKLKGHFYDRATQSLSAPYALDVPSQGYVTAMRPVIDSAGRAVVGFTQTIAGTVNNSAHNSYQYLTVCY